MRNKDNGAEGACAPSTPTALPRPNLVSVLPFYPVLLLCCGLLLLNCPDAGSDLLFAVTPAEGIIVFGNRFQLPVFLLNTVKGLIQGNISLLEPAVISFEAFKAMLEVKILAVQTAYRFSNSGITIFSRLHLTRIKHKKDTPEGGAS